MTIKKGDFIEINYTALTMDENEVFDTTVPEEAEKAGLLNEEAEEAHKVTKEDFKPLKICVGESHVLPGLDEHLVGLNIGEHDIILGEENAFGKKDPKNLKLLSMNAFKKQKINPFVGLTLDMEGSRGTVRSVSGGRVIVDFNHPLSGKAVKYQISIIRKIDDLKEKAESMLSLYRLPYESLDVKDGDLIVNLDIDLPEEVLNKLKEEMTKTLNTKISFNKKETTKKETKPEDTKKV